MPTWNRRGFLKLLGLMAGIPLLSSRAVAGTFFLKKFLGSPPRETKAITPNDEFYVYHYGNSAYRLVKDLDLKKWSLEIGGRVRKPLSLSYANLVEREPTRMTATIECIENPVGGESIGNAAWQGVSLDSLLEEAEVLEGVKDVVIRGADGYSDSIPLERALSGKILLAYEMNHKQLPRQHGFPLRAVVPGIYGMKNVKWITQIELVDHDYQGYWQQRGWSDQAFVRITSRIDFPGAYQDLPLSSHTLRGIAYSGDKGIRSVELSVDGGTNWVQANLEEPLSPYSWVIWNKDWTPPKTGTYSLVVRATDRSGAKQEIEPSPAFPNGPTGLHRVTVQIVG